jgi:hypothetical protein
MGTVNERPYGELHRALEDLNDAYPRAELTTAPQCPRCRKRPEFSGGNRPRRAVRHFKRSCELSSLSSLTNSSAHSRASGIFPASRKARAFAKAWLSDRRVAADSLSGRASRALRSAADGLRMVLIQLGSRGRQISTVNAWSQRLSGAGQITVWLPRMVEGDRRSPPGRESECRREMAPPPMRRPGTPVAQPCATTE